MLRPLLGKNDSELSQWRNAFREALGPNVFPLKVPALRERKEDIALLATHFVALLVKELGCPKPRLTRAGIETLQGYDSPGNIRELRNVIERAVIIARGGALEFDLPVTGSSVDLTSFGPQDDDAPEPEYLTESEMRRRERENLLAILQKAGWKVKGIDGVAEVLGVKATTLVARIKRWVSSDLLKGRRSLCNERILFRHRKHDTGYFRGDTSAGTPLTLHLVSSSIG